MITFTEEQLKTSLTNRDLRRKELGISGNGDLVLHHKDINLRHNNPERYIQWNIEDLEIMNRSEHSKLHSNLLKEDEEWRKSCANHNHTSWNKGLTKENNESLRRISEKMKGRKPSQKSMEKFLDMVHKPKSEETKKKISEAHKGKVGCALGKHWYHNNEIETYALECPDGFIKGRLPGRGGHPSKLKRYAELTGIETVRTKE